MRGSFGHVRFSMTVGAVLVALGAAACGNPVTPEDHPEAGGVVILHAGTGAVLAQSIGSVAAFNQPLVLSAGETLEVEVLFLDASATSNLEIAFHPHEDEGESLRAVVADTGILEYHDLGEHGAFEAKSAGQTTVKFDLMHGGHADFSSGELAVIVE